MFMSTPWKWNIKIWQFFFSSFLAIETFQNNSILEFYLNLILLFDGMLPVLKKANSLLEMRRDIKLFSFSFLTLFSMFFLLATKSPTKSFCANFCSKWKNNLGYDCYKGFFWKIIIIIRQKKQGFWIRFTKFRVLTPPTTKQQ